MKLSDVMGAAGLSLYAELALVLFISAFAIVVFQIVARGKARDWDAASQLPLSDARTVGESAGRSTTSTEIS